MSSTSFLEVNNWISAGFFNSFNFLISFCWRTGLFKVFRSLYRLCFSFSALGTLLSDVVLWLTLTLAGLTLTVSAIDWSGGGVVLNFVLLPEFYIWSCFRDLDAYVSRDGYFNERLFCLSVREIPSCWASFIATSFRTVGLFGSISCMDPFSMS